MIPNPGSDLPKIRDIVVGMPKLLASFVTAFFISGFPEELIKFLVIILFGLFFRPKIKNLYEYILIGAAVGFGFTLAEEFLYAADLTTFLTRAITNQFGIFMRIKKSSLDSHRPKARTSIGEIIVIWISISIYPSDGCPQWKEGGNLST